MLPKKNIDSNNSKYIEILTENIKISGQYVKLLPVLTTFGEASI